ncbi:hypothetical protein CGRA01v4_09788 [Colletotrichum graminicola]|nr:hypothetical protein CGRA01v4_09788 [Colletotrichum graminicola]
MLPSSVLGSLTQKDAACRGACCAGIRGRILEHRGKWTSDQPSRDARAGAGSRRITTHRPCFPGQTQTHDINHAYSRVFKQIGIEMQDTMKYQGISDGLAIVFWSGFISALDTEARSNELSITTMVSFAFDTRTFYLLFVVCNVTNAIIL